MVELIAVVTITVLAVISPGADFAMVTRNSLLHGRQTGLLAALGIAAGVQLHVFYSMLGVAVVIQQSPQWFSAIKVCGALYLMYVGYQTWCSSPPQGDATRSAHGELGPWKALGAGFFTNALNPKTTLFVLSVYSQVIDRDTPLAVQIGYGLFMSAAHAVWFGMVATFFSEPVLRERMLRHQKHLNRLIGIALGGLGLTLALS
jgi:RhtB (resistance to homoserine/threonine) family protein